MSKDIFRRLAVLIAVLVSGLGLSLLFVVRISVADLLMLLAAPIVAAAFVPRKDWLRVGAFVFLVASVYGVGRIAAEVARSTLDQTSMLRSWDQYGAEGLLYLLYGFIWLIWWWKNRTNSRQG